MRDSLGMPRLRVKIPVDVELEPEQLDVVNAFAALVRTVRESGTADAAARLLGAVTTAARSSRARRP